MKWNSHLTKIFSFDEFKTLCADKGYTADEEPKNKLYYIRTKNSVKTEISYGKKLTYTIGYGLKTENLVLLEEEVIAKGFKIGSKGKRQYLRLVAVNDDTLMSRFWELVAVLEDIEGIVARSRGIATKVFTKEVDETDKFEKIAGRYFYAIENKDQELLDLGRDLLSGDSIDHIITRGESVGRTDEDTYREHIVPCIMIHNEAIRMAVSGSTRAEVAQMIASNLAIVRITNAEADLLDNKLKLRTCMPADWKFGDDVFARLTVAKIQLK
jgi:hypothetical protein